MSIIIKGMEMPTSCGGCKLRMAVGCCGNLPHNTRVPTCPVIELTPHGRLIDADAVVNQLKAVAPNGSSGWVYYNGLCQIIKITPTIVEAEGVE